MPTRPSDAPQGEETPNLDFEAATPYEEYVHAEVLTHLQRPLSDDPGELSFLVTTQVMELWFTALVHEFSTAAAALRRDDLPAALAALRRSTRELAALNASWEPLAHLTPAQFNAYRGALGDGSGFQSAMYRRLEFLLGEKSTSMLVPHRGSPRVYRELEEALHRPGVYDEALAYLARCGAPVPEEVLRRDVSEAYRPHPGVEEAWAAIYADERAEAEGAAGDAGVVAAPESGRGPLRLGEALVEVAELVWRWRNDHLLATRRAMGAKTGTGGSSGVAWLEKRAAKPVFPELWTARSRV